MPNPHRPFAKVSHRGGCEFLEPRLLLAAPEVTLNEVGVLGGGIEGVAVADGYAYVTVGPWGLQVVDVRTPESPRIVGMLDTDMALGVDVSGNYAYIADGESGLTIVDVSDPAAPELVSTLPTTEPAMHVTVSGSHVYLYQQYSPGSDSFLEIIDVTDPAAPVSLSQYELEGHLNNPVCVSGSYAYIANVNGLQIVDVSDPASPTLAGTYLDPLYASSGMGGSVDVAVAGSYAYVPGMRLGVVDISNPVSPTLVGTLGGERVMRIRVAGSHAYALNNTLQVIDIGDPASPKVQGTEYYVGGKVLSVADGYAYVTGLTGEAGVALTGMKILNVSNAYTPTVVGSHVVLGSPVDIVVNGSHAYIGDGGNGLVVVDVSNPLLPSPVGATPWVYNRGAGELALRDAYVYHTDMGSMTVTSVQDPTHPSRLGSFAGPPAEYDGRDVAASGQHVYLADTDRLRIFDVANAPSFSVVSTLPMAAEQLAVAGSYAYIARDQGLAIVDVSRAVAPALVGSYDLAGDYRQVAVAGSYVYLASGPAGLQIFNASDPTSPTLVANYDTPGYVSGVIVVGSFAYVADREAGLYVLDVSDPAHPELLASNSTPALRVAVSGDYAYVIEHGMANSTTKYHPALHILRIVAPDPQTITFDDLPDKVYGDPPFAISATASSGLPVSFSIVSGPATIDGNIITLTGTGTVTVRASQAGNVDYLPATPSNSPSRSLRPPSGSPSPTSPTKPSARHPSRSPPPPPPACPSPSRSSPAPQPWPATS